MLQFHIQMNKNIKQIRLFIGFITIILLSFQGRSQEFMWANSYDISNCNEVAALATDADGNLFISGVYDAPVSLPYTGDCYIQKANPEGQIIWSEYFAGNLQIGDLATVGNSAIIIGQSNGEFSYKGIQYGSSGIYFMFVLMINPSGNIEWFYMDEAKFGANTNISVGEQGKIALYVRGQYNLSDWLMIMDTEGNILNSRHLYATKTLGVEMAYYNEKIYLNGGLTGPGDILIDDVPIQLPPIENAAFVLALDEDLVAEWVVIDTTINNRDGRIVVNNVGIFAYQEVLNTGFNIVSAIKKISFEGELLAEVKAPVFSNAVSLYPDMAITQNKIGLFAQNAFSFNSHKVMFFDFDLNPISEKIISGPSDLYSGQITNYGNDFFVAHVHSGYLNFNDELDLPYSGAGKLPYIAKIETLTITDLPQIKNPAIELLIYPNPASDRIEVIISKDIFSKGKLIIHDISGKIMMRRIVSENNFAIDISDMQVGVYIIQLQLNNGMSLQKKILIR